jgi:AcrR family transcriptional regulator
MPDQPADTRRERQIAQRLEQILDAAARLFATKGFHRTTTKEIAEAAQVSEGTLYNYFDSKDDLLLAIIARLAESQSREIRPSETIHSDARQLFISLLGELRGSTEKYVAMQQTILSEILTDGELRERYLKQLLEPTLTSLEKQLQLRIALGQIRPVDPILSARVLASMVLGLFILQVLGDPPVQTDWEALVEIAASIVFDGLEAKDRFT